MNFICNKKVFATAEKAEAYADEYRKKTGIFLAVEHTNKKVTHVYKF